MYPDLWGKCQSQVGGGRAATVARQLPEFGPLLMPCKASCLLPLYVTVSLTAVVAALTKPMVVYHWPVQGNNIMISNCTEYCRFCCL